MIEPIMNYNPISINKLSKNYFLKSGEFNTQISKFSEIDYQVKVGRNCLIDSGVKISEKCDLQNSIICKDVTIGQKVQIKNSLILSGSTIQNGAKIINSYIASDQLIKADSVLINSNVNSKGEVSQVPDS
jgi:NDP-sugar pyrophosphorylase family protein